MCLLYSACDAVISRAGATSIAEITLFGRASVLIPYPSVKVHQFENARFMEEREAAVVVEQGDSCAARLSEALRMLMNDPSRLRTLAQNAAKLGRPDAADRLAAEILLTLKKESR